MKCDVAIIGAGAAGIAAAVAAAESGLKKVILIERYGFTGGLATSALVGTICGLYFRNMDNTHYAVQGFARDFANGVMSTSNTQPKMFAEGLHFLPYQPAVFHQQAVQQLKKADVELFLHMYVSQVKVSDKKISELLINTCTRQFCIMPTAVVDCSGNAEISMLAGLDMIKQPSYQSGAYVFQVSGLPSMEPQILALNLIRWIKRGIQLGELDPYCDWLSIIPGTVNNGMAYLKLGLPRLFDTDLMCLTEYELDARSRCIEIIDYLRSAEPLCKSLSIINMATQVGIRSGPRSQGIKILDSEHVLACAKPDDGIAIGAWPIEYWGKQRKPEMNYFKMDDYYLIPAGTLVSRDLDNLFFAGKALSATELAIASARVIGTCLSTGYAAGMLAAEFSQNGSWQTAIARIRNKQVFSNDVRGNAR